MHKFTTLFYTKFGKFFHLAVPTFWETVGYKSKAKACKQASRLKVHPLGTIDSLDHGEFYRTP
jgi:hypothetical protein